MEEEQNKFEEEIDFKNEFLSMIERGARCENSTAKKVLNDILSYK